MKKTKHIVTKKSNNNFIPRAKITWYETIDSTNNEALRKISQLDNLSVLAAKTQTAGRGQKGNSWKSGSFQNLTFSMILKFPTPAKYNVIDSANSNVIDPCNSNVINSVNSFIDKPLLAINQFSISKAVTSGIVDFLLNKGIVAKIKWPNDIYVNNKKICGILIENSLQGKYVKNSVVGIGLNVNQKTFSSELINPTSIALENTTTNSSTKCQNYSNEEIDLYNALEELTAAIIKRLYDDIELTNIFYINNLYRLGETYEYVDLKDNINFYGTILGISPYGLLNIRVDQILNNFLESYENSNDALMLSNKITHNDIHRSNLKSADKDKDRNQNLNENENQTKENETKENETKESETKNITEKPYVKEYGFKEISYII